MFTPAVLSAAVALAAVTQPAAAIDYPGGWLPSPPNEQCVDICANSNPKPYCFDTTSTTCPLKQQRPGDFDWMAFEQLFVPQFCRDLLKGVDTTLSHQNVNPAPNGLACQPDVVKTELTIHGLWPNYNGGYAGCCNVTDTIPNKPFDAADFARHHKSLLNKMKKQWIEPTQSTAYEALCHIYNHEFQKHGLCYNAFGDDYEQAAVNYFQSALAVAKELKHATKQINEWAEDHETTTVAAIKSLYDKNVMVLCSTPDPSNKFSGIRSCWDKPETLDSDGPFVQIDCPELKAGAQFTPCDAANPITLTEYELGGAEATAF